MLGARYALLWLLLTAFASYAATRAHAQVGASASLDSDDLFRGFSLSAGKPTLSLNLSYDHSSGAYAGLSALASETSHGGAEVLGLVGNLGYVSRIDASTSWDIGATNTTIKRYSYKNYTATYGEVYTGIVHNNIQFYLHYSPNYLGEDIETVYLDVAGTLHPAAHWRLFGRVGALTPVGGRGAAGNRREQYDLNAGVAYEFGKAELRLAWTSTFPYAEYPRGHIQGRDALVAGVSYYF